MLPRNLVSLYEAYTYTAIDTGFAFAYDSIEGWRDIAQYVAEVGQAVLRDLASDYRLQAQEKEFFDKAMVCWRDRGYATLYVEDERELTCRNASQANLLRGEFSRRRKQYVTYMQSMTDDELLQLYNAGPVVLNKGKGAPYWNPGSDKQAALALAKLASGASSYADLQQRVMGPGAALLPFVQTSYIRIQGARKPGASYAIVDGKPVQTGERVGPKVRRIGAQPFATNHLWAGVGNVLRTLMSEMDDRNTGTIKPAAVAMADWKLTAAFDLASYDSTVSIETLDAFHEEMLAPILSYLVMRNVMPAGLAALLIDADHAAQRMPVLLPPRNRSEAAWLAKAEGQIRSGENLTSWKGTEINRCRIDAKARALGMNTSQYQAFNYGDDTILMFRNNDALREWADAKTFAGFEETVAPDTTFLMRRLPVGHTYLGRMLAACVNREVHAEPLTVLAAAAAFATRMALLRGHPLADRLLVALRGWQRPDRWQAAAELASTDTSAVALTMAAAAEQRALFPARNLDDVQQDLDRLSEGANIAEPLKAEAELASAALTKEEIDERRQIQWGQLQKLVTEMTVSEAEQLIRERSYEIARLRAN